MENKITIAMYHYVRNLSQSRYKEIKGLDVGLFKEQISYLNKNYSIIRMEDLISAIDNNESLPPKACLLTFDDGYKDHFEYVFPILDKYKLKGAFYPPAKAILNQEVLFVNKIHFILAAVGYLNLNKLLIELYKKLDYYKIEFNLESKEFYFNKLAKANEFDIKEVIFIKRLLQVELKKNIREIIANELFEEFVTNDEKAFANELYMSHDQLDCLLKNGMHIGSHGYNHDWLNSLTKLEQENEIIKSINFLNIIGVYKNYTMCYPYGGHDEITMKLLRKYNFKLGLTTMFDISDIRQNNKFQLRRLDTNHLPKKREEIAENNIWYQKHN
jgi:peptidoglycan/xylan/chitin deacetylase (PgdA/CDA1 family)